MTFSRTAARFGPRRFAVCGGIRLSSTAAEYVQRTKGGIDNVHHPGVIAYDNVDRDFREWRPSAGIISNPVTEVSIARMPVTSYGMDFHHTDNALSRTHPPRQSRGTSLGGYISTGWAQDG
jgi:hypothetical protein